MRCEQTLSVPVTLPSTLTFLTLGLPTPLTLNDLAN